MREHRKTTVDRGNQRREKERATKNNQRKQMKATRTDGNRYQQSDKAIKLPEKRRKVSALQTNLFSIARSNIMSNKNRRKAMEYHVFLFGWITGSYTANSLAFKATSCDNFNNTSSQVLPSAFLAA